MQGHIETMASVRSLHTRIVSNRVGHPQYLPKLRASEVAARDLNRTVPPRLFSKLISHGPMIGDQPPLLRPPAGADYANLPATLPIIATAVPEPQLPESSVPCPRCVGARHSRL